MTRAATLICALAVTGAIAAAAAMAAGPPVATTLPAPNVTATSATLRGSVNPNELATTYHFDYGRTTAYGSRTPDAGPVNGKKARNVSASVAGLLPSATYHFRVVATNSSGTVAGADMTFTTPAAGPNTNLVTISAKPRPVTFGKATVISGQVTGPGNGGVNVELDQTPWPYAAPFARAQTGTTTATGTYTFAAAPGVNTRYHVVASTKPRAQSPDLTVNVRPRVGLRVGDTTPRHGQRVRFSGSVAPTHDGRSVRIQRRTSKGWRTIATALLRPGTPVNGIARSVYGKRIRVRHGGYYRTLFVPADGDHVRGKSARHRVRVH